MENSALKKKLIYRINAADEKALLLVDQLLDNLEQKQEDFFDTVPTEIQKLLLESIKQIDNGQTYSNEQVREMTNEKYGLKENLDFANPPQEISDLLEVAKKQVTNGQTRSNEEVKELIKNKYGFHIK